MEKYEYLQRRSLPLSAKVQLSLKRIREAYAYFNSQVYVSFSGGKDSTVLLHLVRSIYPEVPAVFFNTGLEYPELVAFVKAFSTVEIIRPKKTFKEVVETYGWPVISKEVSQKIKDLRSKTISDAYRYKLINGTSKGGRSSIRKKWLFLTEAPFKISGHCCAVMKKQPAHAYEKRTGRAPMIGTMASDSKLREQNYLKNGCNAFNNARPISAPLSIWTEADIWQYIKGNGLPYCNIYDTGVERTGCLFCLFGIAQEKTNRFDLLKKSHPHLYKYCMETLGMAKILEYIKSRGGAVQPELLP